MKIHLERDRNPHHHLQCLACQQAYIGNRLRTLLCHDDGSIAGDICLKCIKLGASYIQKQIETRSIELFRYSATDELSLSIYRQALELSELAAQPLAIPPFYYWWWQKMTILAVETQELEIAKTEAVNVRYRQPKPYKITFFKEKPSVGKDN